MMMRKLATSPSSFCRHRRRPLTLPTFLPDSGGFHRRISLFSVEKAPPPRAFLFEDPRAIKSTLSSSPPRRTAISPPYIFGTRGIFYSSAGCRCSASLDTIEPHSYLPNCSTRRFAGSGRFFSASAWSCSAAAAAPPVTSPHRLSPAGMALLSTATTRLDLTMMKAATSTTTPESMALNLFGLSRDLQEAIRSWDPNAPPSTSTSLPTATTSTAEPAASELESRPPSLIFVMQKWLTAWIDLGEPLFYRQPDSYLPTPHQVGGWLEEKIPSIDSNHTVTNRDQAKVLYEVYTLLLEGALQHHHVMEGDNQPYLIPALKKHAQWLETVLSRIMHYAAIVLPPLPTVEEGSTIIPPHPTELPVPPSSITLISKAYRQVIDLFCKANKAEEADRLLLFLESSWTARTHPYTYLSRNFVPFMYSMVLETWAKERNPRKAEAWLQKKLSLSSPVHPAAKDFETCIKAWLKAEESVSGQRAELLLLQMEDWSRQTGRSDLRPNLRTYAKVIEAWVVSGRQESANRALAILRLMEDMDMFKPAGDVTAAKDRSDRDPQNPQKAMIDCYVQVIRALSMSGQAQAPEQAQALYQELMDDRLGEGSLNNTQAKNLYSSLLHVWARSGRTDEAVQQAHHIMADWQRRRDQKQVNLEMDMNLYNRLLTIYGRAGEGMLAELVFRQVLEQADRRVGYHLIEPNTFTFNLVILAWSKSKAPDADVRAEKMYSLMKEMKVRPDAATINVLLAALSAGPADKPMECVERAEMYLRELESLYKTSGGSSDCRPDVVTYTKLITVWSRVKSNKSIPSAFALLKEMDDRHGLKPTLHTYLALSSVLQQNEHPDKRALMKDVQVQIRRFRRSRDS